MKSEYLLYMYVFAVMLYVGMKVFHIHLRVLDSFFVMFCGLCVVLSLVSIVKILAEDKN